MQVRWRFHYSRMNKLGDWVMQHEFQTVYYKCIWIICKWLCASQFNLYFFGKVDIALLYPLEPPIKKGKLRLENVISKRYCTVWLVFCASEFVLVTLKFRDDSKLRGYVMRKYLYVVNHLTYSRKCSKWECDGRLWSWVGVHPTCKMSLDMQDFNLRRYFLPLQVVMLLGSKQQEHSWDP